MRDGGDGGVRARGVRYVRGRFQYSGGVAAEPGYAIERARFHRPVPLGEGFRRIEAYLGDLGRPTTAFCACELRSPGQFTEEGFVAFNRAYVGTLERWGIFKDEENPVARSNVCPEVDPPAEPSFHAFSYTVPAPTGEAPDVKSFVIAGSGEAPEGPGGTASGSSASVTALRMRCGRRRGTFSGRWKAAWRRSDCGGRTPP